MKKIYLVFLLFCVWVNAAAQSECAIKFMRFYVPNSNGSPFPTSVDAYATILEDGKPYIKIHANNPYNAAEFSDYQKYAVLKDSSMYMKLDNNEIIILTCSLNKSVKDGFVTTKNNVYQNYADYSYFPIDTVVIEKLKNNNIVKIRCAFKFEILDGSMQFTSSSDMPETKDSFKQAETNVRKKYIETKNKANGQKVLKENPLLGF